MKICDLSCQHVLNETRYYAVYFNYKAVLKHSMANKAYFESSCSNWWQQYWKLGKLWLPLNIIFMITMKIKTIFVVTQCYYFLLLFDFCFYFFFIFLFRMLLLTDFFDIYIPYIQSYKIFMNSSKLFCDFTFNCFFLDFQPIICFGYFCINFFLNFFLYIFCFIFLVCQFCFLN